MNEGNPLPELGGRRWVGDVFADLYDWLDERPAWVEDQVAEEWSPLDARVVTAIREADGDVPDALREAYVAAVRDLGAARGVIATAQALDTAFETVRMDEGWPRLRRHLRAKGTLTRERAGALLPLPEHEVSLPRHHTEQYFANVRRLLPEGDFAVRWAPLPSRAEVRARAGLVRVVFVPCVDKHDLDFGLIRAVPADAPAGTRAHFDTPHRKGAEDRVFERLKRAILLAEREDAQLLLAPELALTPAVWERVRKEVLPGLRASAGRGLRLLLLGTAAVDRVDGLHRNQALLVDRFGEEILRQNKCHPFTLDEQQQRFYGLDGACCGQEPCEPIRLHPRELHLRDSRTLGRFAVLICEDLAVLEPGPRAAARLGSDLFLSPVMDGSLTAGRWVDRWSAVHKELAGIRVAVANSMYFATLAPTGAPPFGVGLVRGKGDRTPRLFETRSVEDGLVVDVPLAVG